MRNHVLISTKVDPVISNRPNHRRRIKTKEKSKVVAAVGVKEFNQFLVALAIFTRGI